MTDLLSLNSNTVKHEPGKHVLLFSVMRTQGSLRVILNTKIWAGMNVERASTKAIRITATDVDQAVRVFLIMVSPLSVHFLSSACKPSDYAL